MKTFVLLSVLLLMFYKIFGSSSVTIIYKATHPDFPGKCYLQDPRTVLSIGETKTLAGKCERAICARNMDVEIHKCGTIVETKGCKLTPTNYDRPYPECCPRIKC